ncbi:multiple sugar transport system permease protein [Mobilisporobacter senegalensis]|uniref:Multiple sugar transport system permease protein n=1 Tax=Mobilisporobacter senegalensis TaxID=1329262 RepID=A0A3N1XUX5_9FIRM|nr:carbohydrate ABC transporter permease [Mobilisporobacter senegalensis]ROR30424.1 multiple sugar transport system permease protein [Mobilisporobacter senegalensis]
MSTKVKKTILYIAIIILSVICLCPFLLMMVNATRSGREIMTSFTLIPGNNIKDNWNTMSGYFNIFRGLLNSLFIAVCCTILTAYFSALTAYALAIYKFRGMKIIFISILIFMMIPAQLGLLGFYDLVNAMTLTDNYIPLIIPAIASPATVFFLRQYTLATLPKALLEAARIDGANEIRIFHKIVLPIMAPGIATMSIGTFIGSWNNYLTPLILLYSPKKFTLPIMMGSMKASQDITSNQGAIYLTVAISVLPIMIAFAFCSKYIISGISAGGIKE